MSLKRFHFEFRISEYMIVEKLFVHHQKSLALPMTNVAYFWNDYVYKGMSATKKLLVLQVIWVLTVLPA
jgi:hypothetical protein